MLVRRIEVLSALVELVARVNSLVDLEQAGGVTAESVAEWLAADGVAVFWQRKSDQAGVIIGDAGTAATESREQEAILHAAAEEVLTRSFIADSHATAKRDQVALMALRRYVQATGARRAIAVPLGPEAKNEADRICRGAVLLRFDKTLSENEAAEIRARLDATRDPLFAVLAKLASTQPSRWTRWYRKAMGNGNAAKRKLMMVITILVIGVLLIPLPYQAPIQSELQPIGRRFVAAPIAGPLEKVLVRPGDSVRAGEVLARLDKREIEMELAGKRAEWIRLQQERKGQLAQHKFAESKLAALRAERLQSEIELLELRRSRLAVTAPIDGVVVSGDWSRSEGTLLDRGETLFEIAPLGHYIVEIAIDEADVQRLRIGMPVRFRLDAMPNQRFESTIDRIHPRSELRDGENVFVAEADLVDVDGLVRPGMRGSGHVETDSHAIGWNLFHKAYHRLLFSLGV